MRKYSVVDLTKIANSNFLDEFDDLYEREVVRESKELRKGKDPHHGFKKDTEGSF
jgi:hypothetical protein